MNRSVKSFITGIIILLASATLSASMNFNFFNGESANFIMDSVFRSMRKGITPPFNELEIRNKKLLGKNYDGTLSFSNEATARAATIILMNNKLLIEPDGKNVTIKGDLGYTLKYFLGDIQRMYYNRGDILEARYSMPVKESMYIVSQILNRLSLDLKHKMQPEPRLLVDDIINKALIPTYNMYGTDPLEITSGIIILTSGTFFILIFSLLWDVGFISILRNLDQDGFYNQFRHDFSSSGPKGKVSKNSSKKSSAKVTKNKTQAEIKSAKNSKSSLTKSQNSVEPESGKAVQKKIQIHREKRYKKNKVRRGRIKS
jgi:hypothetical protein